MKAFDYHFYNNLKYSNKIMQNENKSHKERNSINHNLVNYKTNNTSSLTIFNTVLIILYYLVLGYFIYVFLMNTKTVLPINKVIIGLLLLYPFIIQPIQQLLYGVYRSTIEYLFNTNMSESFVESMSQKDKQYLSEQELEDVNRFNQEYKDYIQTIKDTIQEQTAQELQVSFDEWIAANKINTEVSTPINFSDEELEQISQEIGVSQNLLDEFFDDINNNIDEQNPVSLEEMFDSLSPEQQEKYKDLKDDLGVINGVNSNKKNDFIQKFMVTNTNNNKMLNEIHNNATFIQNNKDEINFTNGSIRQENKEHENYIMYSNLLLAGLSTTILYFIFTEL
tara:strand:+ start:2125 stop:3135 length:1011 start_codon:yes stop_codon:yes gene_type:complete